MTYHEILAVCIARFGMTLVEAERCSVRKFGILDLAHRLKTEEEVYHLNLLAWQSNQAGAVKRNGKPVFRKFNEMYDYEKNFIRALRGESDTDKKQNSIADTNMLLNS